MIVRPSLPWGRTLTSVGGAAAALSAAALAACHPVPAVAPGAAPVPLGESRQIVDTAFVPAPRGAPTYAAGTGPRVVIDEAHRNFHTAAGRYRPFARLLETDGYVVSRGQSPFDSASLAAARVLVVANALGAGHDAAVGWTLPAVSAFTPAEIDAVVAWVRRGGALLLIADHMPFAGDAASLGSRLGVELLNGFALLGDADPRTGDYPIVFRRGDGTLGTHAVTAAGAATAPIDSVESFTGSAFRLHDGNASATALMTLPPATRVLLPDAAWVFTPSTRRADGPGLLQGAAFPFGRGRVAVFGEAAMFTAQRKGVERVPMGMNAPAASENAEFVRRVLRWLAGGATGF